MVTHATQDRAAKVWLVWYDPETYDECASLEGIFTTEEAAQAYRLRCIEKHGEDRHWQVADERLFSSSDAPLPGWFGHV